MQVLDELRQGVTKLRKVERQSKMSIEYELTPYEILMEDIRQQKYTLKKVCIDVLFALFCPVFRFVLSLLTHWLALLTTVSCCSTQKTVKLLLRFSGKLASGKI